MNPKVIFVVGDKFSVFRTGKDHVLLFSEYAALSRRGAPYTAKDYIFVPGQGLSTVETQILLSRVNGPNRDFIEQLGVSGRCGNTHKTDKRNILVTDPLLVGPNMFRADLVIDDDCAELLDHTTGRHIPGMLLIEAARQMLIAATELHSVGDKRKVSFVINNVNASFLTFAFPLPTRLVATWERSEGRHSSAHFLANVQVIQAGQCIAEIRFEYSTLEPAVIDRQERLRSLSSEALARSQTESAYAAQMSYAANLCFGDA